jgi:hypothetical protein
MPSQGTAKSAGLVSRRTILSATGRIAAVGAIAGVQAPFILSARGDTPVKIGMILAKTGVATEQAQYLSQGTFLALEQASNSVIGRPCEIVWLDDPDPQTGQQNITRSKSLPWLAARQARPLLPNPPSQTAGRSRSLPTPRPHAKSPERTAIDTRSESRPRHRYSRGRWRPTSRASARSGTSLRPHTLMAKTCIDRWRRCCRKRAEPL